MDKDMDMDINPSLGLVKLTEYLNQTRRQSEMAIDLLNERIHELSTENDKAMKMAEKFEGERDYYRNYAEQLKLQNSKKWKLQERDDWKSLVESVQNDRSRLQEDCIKLKELLDEANHRIEVLETEVNDSRFHNSNNNNNNDNNIPDNNNNNNIPSSPSHSNQNRPLQSVAMTPTSQIRSLRGEVEKLTYERDMEKRNIETHKKAKEIEISRLKEELKEMSKEKSRIKRNNNNDSSNILVSKVTAFDKESWGWIGFLFSAKPSPNSAILRV